MSQINLNPIPTTGVGTDPGTKIVRPQPPANAAPPIPTDSTAGQDTVTLSAAALTAPSSGTGATDLTETQATTASVALRQQLGNQSLSATARQNQSILSLLRG
jgi:hypothetical protein